MATQQNLTRNLQQNPKRILERVFNSTHARVLDFLIMNQHFDYSHSDICKSAGISPRSLDRILPVLLEEKLVIKTGKSGKAYMYMFNNNSEKGRLLEKYCKIALKENIEFIKNPNTKSEKFFGQQKLQNHVQSK